MASSTNNHSERTNEKRERKFNVCPTSLRTTKVSKKTMGMVNVGTSASLKPIKRSNVPHTKIRVIIKSTVNPERSSRIFSEKSVVVCTTTSGGIAHDICIALTVFCPISTRSMIDPPDFLITESVTAGTGAFPSIESRDSEFRFLGLSVSVAISLRNTIPGSPIFATGISRSVCRL